MRLPHPLILMLGAVAIAAALTWIVPAGAFDRRDDPSTGRRVVVAGTYHRVPAAPVGLFAAAVAVPRGFVAAAEVIAVVLFVGGAWVVVDRLGTLPALVDAHRGAIRRSRAVGDSGGLRFSSRRWARSRTCRRRSFRSCPVLLVLGRGLGVDAVAVVAMSAGAAMIGSAFGPTNPFQAGIALKLAQLPPRRRRRAAARDVRRGARRLDRVDDAPRDAPRAAAADATSPATAMRTQRQPFRRDRRVARSTC